MVPGKKMEANEGIRFLTGKGKIDIPLKKIKKDKHEVKTAANAGNLSTFNTPVTSKCTVDEKGVKRTFTVTIERINGDGGPKADNAAPETGSEEVKVFSTFAGSVDIADVLVKPGDNVGKGDVLVQVEAMKAKFDIKSPKAGIIGEIFVAIGDEVDSSEPILTIK
jgi:biotin carboxyl carrier protein